MKICNKCSEEKSDFEFHINSVGKDGLSSYCKNCDRRVRWENELHQFYGITVKQYELMLKFQNEKCAICNQFETKKQSGKIRRLGVDHNHLTSKIRGLLCYNCNVGIGFFKDDPELLRRAADYLEK